MGFKEIEKFNEALLTKQVWHMINNPDSLCHCVFKARFFLGVFYFRGQRFTYRSYAWKSITGARDVIHKGIVWHIGTGDVVRIKEDKWLPSHTNRTVISPLPQVPEDLKVSILIDQDRVVWKSELV